MTHDYISNFKGEYDFLSCNYVSPIHHAGNTYTCATAAYYAQVNPDNAEQFVGISPGQANVLGPLVKEPADWSTRKDNVMFEVLMSKFRSNVLLRKKLLDTKEAVIMYKNTWHDNYWGMCTCTDCTLSKKENKLGLLLMKVRENLLWEESQRKP